MSDKSPSPTGNSLGQFEEGIDLRAAFDGLWSALKTPSLSPLASLALTWPHVTEKELLEYFVALDDACSGVSRERLSRLLRGGVVPPKVFLPFIARAYELEPEIGTKKRGPKHRMTANYRYWLYCRVCQIMAERGCRKGRAMSELLAELEEAGQPLSDTSLKAILKDFN